MTTPSKNYAEWLAPGSMAHPDRQDELQRRSSPGRVRRSTKKPLRVMKFGGTSVGDAARIENVAKIILEASRDSNLVVVVSAMAGVTNKLIEAATKAESGEHKLVAKIFDELNRQHEAAVAALSLSAQDRKFLLRTTREILQEGDQLCQNVHLLRELTLRARDSVSSLGERLVAPIVAAALAERGEAIEATELIVTNSEHGAAEPRMDQTRERCEARLRPLFQQDFIPVVTGFIGATIEGVLTTFGRGGSDYSATILGAALHADEVIIWTDVDGVLTADPRMVPGACTVSKISYREAAELAYFGAKVLHPKTLRPLMQTGIPLCVRNTFTPGQCGTKITPVGAASECGVKALAANSDVALITIGGPGMVGVRDFLGRTFATTAAVQADILLISQSSSQNDICFAVPAALAKRTVEALRREFEQDLAHEEVEHISLNPDVAIVAVVGENMRGTRGIVGRALGALSRENVDIIANAQGSSECNISFLVAQKNMKAALNAIHEELQLSAEHSDPIPARGA